MLRSSSQKRYFPFLSWNMLLSFPETQNVPPIRNLVESSRPIHSRVRGKHGLLPPSLRLKLKAGFRIEAAKEEAGFKNEATEGKKDHSEIASLNEEMKSLRISGSCNATSAASTGYCLWPGTSARHPATSRRIEIKGWKLGP